MEAPHFNPDKLSGSNINRLEISKTGTVKSILHLREEAKQIEAISAK